jgi:hypothetical protein
MHDRLGRLAGAGILFLSVTSLPAAAATMSFQNGVAPTSAYAGTQDTSIKSDVPATNYGTAVTDTIDGSPDQSVLIKWDVSAVPKGSLVTAATITVNVTNTTPDTYNIYEMKRNWAEGQANWTNYTTASAWQTAGASGANDRASEVLGTMTSTATGLKTFTLNWFGRALVQRWIDVPSTNFGLVLQNYAVTDALYFDSSEAATAANRPKLTLTYGDGSVVKVCFLGDSNTNANAAASIGECKSAGVNAIVHTGDLDYQNSPTIWENFINTEVGRNYPYFYVLGNHDTANAAGYQSNAEARFNRLGLTWTGTLTSHSTHDWHGQRFIMTTPGIGDSSAGTYVHDQAAATTARWVHSLFHENQAKMQVGSVGDLTGWDVYEEGRIEGALTWNGHVHSYGRTHLLSNMSAQTVSDNTSPYTIVKGQSIVIQTGDAGAGLSAFGPNANLPYWASKYNANYGVNICTFGGSSDPTRADCVFRDITGTDRDSWTMFSNR